MTDRPARRTQAERRATTRAALVGAARELFAARGYPAVGTAEIVRAAGVTRGALYHHFDGKDDLFAAVFEAVEADLVADLGGVMAALGDAPALDVLTAGLDGALDMALDPGLARIALVDAPAVLGWERWREIGWRYGMGLVETALQAAIDRGEIDPAPARPLAHVILGALDEAALYVARADDPASARAEMSQVLRRLVAGLAAAP
jgi:AcrR family transcriptional regulator